MRFGKVLKEKRKEQKLTLAQLSERTGLSVVSLCQYESEKKKPTLVSVQKLSKGLNCSFEELYKYYE